MTEPNTEPKEVKISGVTYYIRPFPCFTSVFMLVEAAAVMIPFLDGDYKNLDGQKAEKLARKLVLSDNVAFETDANGTAEVKRLGEDEANMLFCGKVGDLLELAKEVGKVNFSGFF
jgi:hypothetical protein